MRQALANTMHCEAPPPPLCKPTAHSDTCPPPPEHSPTASLWTLAVLGGLVSSVPSPEYPEATTITYMAPGGDRALRGSGTDSSMEPVGRESGAASVGSLDTSEVQTEGIPWTSEAQGGPAGNMRR